MLSKPSIFVIFSSEIKYKNKAHYQRILTFTKKFDVSIILRGGKFTDPELLLKIKNLFRSPFVGSQYKSGVYLRNVGIVQLVNYFIYLIYVFFILSIKAKHKKLLVYTFPGPHTFFVYLAKKIFGNIVWVADIYDHPMNLIVTKFSFKWFLSKIKGFFDSIALKEVDYAFITLVEGSLDAYNIPKTKSLFLTNGVNLSLFDPTKYECDKSIFFELIFIGFILKENGIPTLLQSVKLLKDEIPNIRLNLVGFTSKQDNDWLLHEIEKLGIAKYVHYWGVIDSNEVPSFLSRMDVCLIPFYQVLGKDETFPVKLFEYLSMGKAIVASRLSGISLIVKHEESALLVKPGDSEEMAASILRLKNDILLRRRLEENSIEISKKYDWSIINDKIIFKLYDLLNYRNSDN